MKRKIDKASIEDIYDFYCELKQSDPKLTWDKFAIKANKKFDYEFGESAFRKQITKYQNKLVNKPLLPKENLLRADIRNQYQVEIKKQLNKEYRELRKEYLKNEDIRFFIEKMVQPVNNISKLVVNNNNEKSYVLCISDLQEIGDGYAFDCFNFVYEETKKFIIKNKVEELYLWDGGDNIDGLIRLQDFFYNKGGIVSQFNNYSQALAILLEKLSQLVKIKFSIVNSNHNEIRSLQVKAGTMKADDLTIMILNYVKAYHRNNPNIEWLNVGETADDLQYNLINVQGYNFFQQHGDLKFLKPNQPKQTFDAVNRYFGYDVDYLALSHYHHFDLLHISANKNKGGDKQIIWLPALDNRMNKSNEMTMALSSAPAFIILEIEKGNGITNINKINIPKELWK